MTMLIICKYSVRTVFVAAIYLKLISYPLMIIQVLRSIYVTINSKMIKFENLSLAKLEWKSCSKPPAFTVIITSCTLKAENSCSPVF